MDPYHPYRDWRTYGITRVHMDNATGHVDMNLVSNKPGAYPDVRNASYQDWLTMPVEQREAMVDNTAERNPNVLTQFANMEYIKKAKREQRVTNAVRSDDRVAYRRALAPESFIVYNDAREELDLLRKHMRRQDVPKAVGMDANGNTIEQIEWVQQERKRIQQLNPQPPNAAQLLARLDATETRLIKDWARIKVLANRIATSEWVRDSATWKNIAQANDNATLERFLYEIMTQFPERIRGTRHETPPRTVTYNIMH